MPHPSLEKVWVNLLGVAPLRFYTRVVRAMAGIRVPRALREPVWSSLAQRVGMNVDEAELELADYESFGELFVRRLRPGVRPLDKAAAVVCPVDGCVSAVGRADGERLIQAKGIDYALADLLADAELARRLEGGDFVTLYLRPKDYHRIHSPARADVLAMRHLPGSLLPVQPSVVRNVRGVFVRNERVVFDMQSPVVGRMALVCVGATAVGCISTVFAGVATASGGTQRSFEPPIRLERGEEMAAFNLGSTVILAFEAGRVALQNLAAEQEVRVGQPLGQLPSS